MLDTPATDSKNLFYTASEVAKIKGLTKQAITIACQRGKFEGAFKVPPGPKSKQGAWVIPKILIDQPPIDTSFDTPPIDIELTSQLLAEIQSIHLKTKKNSDILPALATEVRRYCTILGKDKKTSPNIDFAPLVNPLVTPTVSELFTEIHLLRQQVQNQNIILCDLRSRVHEHFLMKNNRWWHCFFSGG